MESRSGDDKPHLPPPSLWPIGFAVGVACLLVGLVVSFPVGFGIGAAITALFGFLWVRDVMRGHASPPPAPAAEPHVPVEAGPAPLPTEGKDAMPKPSPAELATYPRSKFLEGATLGLGAVIGGAVTLPAAGLMILPAFVGQEQEEVDVGPLENFTEGEWTIVTFMLDPEEGEVSRRTAYVRYNGLLDGAPSFTAMSNRCVHLGCPVQPAGLVLDDQRKEAEGAEGEEIRLIPVQGLSAFGCPCHGGAYDTEGNRTAGPPVRALDRYTFSIRNGHLFLGKTYSVSDVESQGAQAKIKAYKLAGPGQHIDGIEKVLYPIQPPGR
ncbi:MAG: Rieske 2Fe-2S domain-containing protein [Gaiellaceae bacterium]